MTDFAGSLRTYRRADGCLLIIHEPALYTPKDTITMQPSTTLDRHVTPSADTTIEERIRFWDTYLEGRTGTYEFRCRRYDAVIDRLHAMGMRKADSVLDLGAGRMEFARRLRERQHVGMYIPVDGSIDGTDLNTWEPPDHVDWAVAIEVIEHLERPDALMTKAKVAARYGLVITTPNPDAVDVLALDPTHITPVSIGDLAQWGYEYETRSLFTKDNDTIIGWFDKQSYERRI